MKEMANIAGKLNRYLPKEITCLIKIISKTANQNSYRAFLVGGFVRDLLLGVENLDVDIVIEGDVERLVKALADELGGSYVLHKSFGTATLAIPWQVRSKGRRLDRVKVDFATARTERYQKPAALPTVEFSNIKKDLARRDFTINAMAVSIRDEDFGRLIDFFSGQKDLAEKKIRVLHDLSFIDDPTRILRAGRFEQRFGFKIEPHTEGLLKAAINKKMIEKTQRHRLRDEVVLILHEEEPQKALKRIEELGGLNFIHPKARFSKEAERLFVSIKKTVFWFEKMRISKKPPEKWLMYLTAILERLTQKEVEGVCREFGFRKSEQMRICSYKKEGRFLLKFLKRPQRILPSEIFKRLNPLSYEVILMLMAKCEDSVAKKRISKFLLKYNSVKLKICGQDLKALGLKPGPQFKRILTETLYAKLDKGLKTKHQELKYVMEFC